mmetsp:Transcript_13545/g.34194  ORF Transcript_13545/g.34194 Transcript_13545/m.34194 type:complete len:284 (-) Transcript_13545:197-1048(-)
MPVALQAARMLPVNQPPSCRTVIRGAVLRCKQALLSPQRLRDMGCRAQQVVPVRHKLLARRDPQPRISQDPRAHAASASVFASFRKTASKLPHQLEDLHKKIAQEYALSEGHTAIVRRDIGRLALILPGFTQEAGRLKSEQVLGLCGLADRLVGKMLELKEIFPNANVSLMIMNSPGLAGMEDYAQVRRIAALYEEQALPLVTKAQLDKIFESAPMLLELNNHSHVVDPEMLLFSISRGNPWLGEETAWQVMAIKQGIVEKLQPDVTSFDRMVVRTRGYGFRC